MANTFNDEYYTEVGDLNIVVPPPPPHVILQVYAIGSILILI